MKDAQTPAKVLEEYTQLATAMQKAYENGYVHTGDAIKEQLKTYCHEHGLYALIGNHPESRSD